MRKAIRCVPQLQGPDASASPNSVANQSLQVSNPEPLNISGNSGSCLFWVTEPVFTSLLQSCPFSLGIKITIIFLPELPFVARKIIYFKKILGFFLFLFYKEMTVHRHTHALSFPSCLKSSLIPFAPLKYFHADSMENYSLYW